MKKVEKKDSSNKVIVVSFAHFVHDIFTSFLKPLLPLLVEKLSLSYTMAGALTVFSRIPSLFNPFIGHFIEKHNLKYFVIATPFITSFFASLIGVMPNYTLLVILLLIVGISSSFFHVPSPVLIKRISKKNIGRGMSFFMIGGEFSRALGPILIMSIVSLWGLAATASLIPFGFMMSFFLYIKLKDIKDVHRDKTDNLRFKDSMKNILKLKKLFIIILGASIIKSFTASVLSTYLPLYLVNKGRSVFLSGSSLSVIALAAVIGVAFSGPMSDKFGRKRVLLTLGILSPLTMFLFLFSSSYLMLPILILVGFISFSTTPVLMALVQENGDKIPAISNGLYMTINFLLSSLIILLAGKLADYFGVEQMLYICSFLSILGIPFLFLLPSKSAT